MLQLGHQLLVEEAEEQAHANARKRRIVTLSFVTEKGMSSIELMPFELHFRFVKSLRNLQPSLKRNVRILSSPHEEKGCLGSGKPFQRIISLPSAKRTRVDIGWIERTNRTDVWMKSGPDRKVSAQTHTVTSDPPRTALMPAEKFYRHIGVLVIGLKLLCIFELVSTVGSCLVIGEHRAEGLEFVINLRNCNKIAVTAQCGSHSSNRIRDLENFRIENDARKASGPLRDEEMNTHGSTRSGKIVECVRDDGHGDLGYTPPQHPFASKSEVS